MLIYSPLCHCCCIDFGQLDGGLTQHLRVGDDALSDVLVSTRHHREARHPPVITAHSAWVERTQPDEDGLHHPVAVWPLQDSEPQRNTCKLQQNPYL